MHNKKVSTFSKKFTKAVSTALVLAMLVSTTVSAKTYTAEDVFDASYYSQTYSDLSKAFGTDAEALLNHYKEYGQKEQRVFTELIDLKKYREAYADLDAAFGDNWDAYLDHYINYGIKEGRNSFGSFDARAYADRYPDLKEAFGYDVLALYNHYLTYGIKEGRNCHADTTAAAAGTNSSSNSNNNGGQSTATVATHGLLLNPETGAAVSNATVRFTRVGSLYTPLASVSGNDATVSGNDATVSGNDADDRTPGQVTQGDGWYEVVTDENGSYIIPDLPAGRYNVSVTASGYLTLNMFNFAIGSSSGNVSMPTFNLLSSDISGSNELVGMAKDAVTGEAIPDVTLKFRADWNNRTGSVIATTTTNENGIYGITLERGYYTIEFAKEGYTSVFVNVFSSNALPVFEGVMQSSMSVVDATQFRVVLTWGAIPSDLDSHLVVPVDEADGSSSCFHIYFANKVCYDANHEIAASLDVDDTTSFGPETVTVINVRTDKPYYYSVHDFSNGLDPNSTDMSASGANVKVYQGSTLVKEYYVPTGKVGTVWNVFKIVNGQIIDINNYGSDYNTIYGDYDYHYEPYDDIYY